ncbi:MAG: hypothetical protein LUC97_06435 [Clostridiales bacterium]|nr:hypothetical protein [Clostridiales bacterium]
MESKGKFNQVEYANNYNREKYDRLAINVPKGIRDKLKAYCKRENTTVNKLINDFISSLNLE